MEEHTHVQTDGKNHRSLLWIAIVNLAKLMTLLPNANWYAQSSWTWSLQCERYKGVTCQATLRAYEYYHAHHIECCG